MPFPFLPAGAVVAASVLIGALTIFGLILRAMDRAIVGLRDTVLSGLVSGLRTWNAARPEHLATASPGATGSSPWGGREPGGSAAGAAGRPTASATTERGAQTDARPELLDLGEHPIEPAAARR